MAACRLYRHAVTSSATCGAIGIRVRPAIALTATGALSPVLHVMQLLLPGHVPLATPKTQLANVFSRSVLRVTRRQLTAMAIRHAYKLPTHPAPRRSYVTERMEISTNGIPTVLSAQPLRNRSASTVAQEIHAIQRQCPKSSHSVLRRRSLCQVRPRSYHGM